MSEGEVATASKSKLRLPRLHEADEGRQDESLGDDEEEEGAEEDEFHDEESHSDLDGGRIQWGAL